MIIGGILETSHKRQLIWRLAKNDFKKRYAGSYLGALWALAQPLITVGMYYIVFGRIFPDQRQSGDVPFVLFLTAGLVPWFFFTEALTYGTNALLDYNYLVKKVVFDVNVLPLIKVIAAVFIHIFFALVLLVLGCVYHYYPSVYTLQIPYYSFCLFMLVLGMCYLTSGVVVFFRDLTQIIVILLQLGMWATPIMWDMDALKSETIKNLLKINPLVYIVRGYRDAVYGGVWFNGSLLYTLYFWAVTALIFFLGRVLFKRLKPHFADVL